MKNKYQEVVADAGTVRESEDCIYCHHKGKELTLDSGCGLGAKADFPQIKPGMYVEVIYRFAKKSWKKSDNKVCLSCCHPKWNHRNGFCSYPEPGGGSCMCSDEK